MNKLEFRYLQLNDKFFYEGQEYKKTSHQRGFYNAGGLTITKRFKKNKIVESEQKRFDLDE